MYDIAGIAQTATKLVIDVGKAYYEYDSAKDAEKAADKAADRTSALNALNERAQQAENAETERRAALTNKQTESLARAKAAASGAAMTGSVSDYLSFLEAENLEEFEWLQKSGASTLNAMQASGATAVQTLKDQADVYGRQATGAAISGVASAFQTGMDAGGWAGDDAWYSATKPTKDTWIGV